MRLVYFVLVSIIWIMSRLLWSCAQVETKFRLDLDDEQAEVYMQQLIGQSLNSIAADLADFFHDWASELKSWSCAYGVSCSRTIGRKYCSSASESCCVLHTKYKSSLKSARECVVVPVLRLADKEGWSIWYFLCCCPAPILQSNTTCLSGPERKNY